MQDCVFCKIISGDFSSYKVYEDDYVLSFLSIEPFSYGHTLIIPKKHYVDYPSIPLEELNHINEVGKIVYDKLNNNLKPDGIKLVQNNGVIQEVKHYHLHMIPIYKKEPDNKEDLETVLNNILK